VASRRALVVALAAVLVMGVPAAAWAQADPTPEPTPEPGVTIAASKPAVRIGGSVTLSGKVTPAAPGQIVQIVDDEGVVRGQDETGGRGGYKVTLTPRNNVRVRAVWGAVASEWIGIGVRPIVTSSLRRVHLFGRAVVRGRVRPRHPNAIVGVRLLRWGKVVARRRARLNEHSRYSVRFYVPRPGVYRARVRFDAPDLMGKTSATGRREPPLPSLGVGATNLYVRLLEKRLRRLNYHLRGINRRYDHRTADALRAFNKVQGRRRLGWVKASTWYALSSPRRPRPRASSPYFHIEVNQSKQVLYTVTNGRVTNVLHVSTGAPRTPTYDGVYRFFRKLAGYSPGRLYYPSYFDGRRATHGWPSVPTYAASHGCVRVPMWAARWLYGKISIGDQIRIYH
jgi:N-acetylmuramoyl-L-alanine amidase